MRVPKGMSDQVYLPSLQDVVDKMQQDPRAEREESEKGSSSSIDDAIMSELLGGRAASSRKRKKRRQRRRKTYPERLQAKLGEAHTMYFMREFEEAKEVLLSIIAEEPSFPDAYETLGLIFESQGDIKQALEVFLLAAHFHKNNALVWRRVAEVARNAQDVETAIYCFSKLINFEAEAKYAYIQRSTLFKEKGDMRRALIDLERAHDRFPDDSIVLTQLCLAYRENGMCDKAIGLINTYLDSIGILGIVVREQTQQLADRQRDALPLVVLLCRLFIQTEQYDDVLDLVQSMEGCWLVQGNTAVVSLKGISELYLGNKKRADAILMQLFARDCVVNYDLFIEACDAYLDMQDYKKAFVALDKLAQNAVTNDFNIWFRLAKCHNGLGDKKQATQYALDAFHSQPENAEFRMLLSTLYQETGETERALELVRDLAGSKVSQDVFDVEDAPLLASQKDAEDKEEKNRIRNNIERHWWFDDDPPITEEELPLLLHAASIQLENQKYDTFLSSFYDMLCRVVRAASSFLSRSHTIRKVPRLLCERDTIELILNCTKALSIEERYEEAIELTTFISRMSSESINPDIEPLVGQARAMCISLSQHSEQPELGVSYMRGMLKDRIHDAPTMNIFGDLLRSALYPDRDRSWLVRLFKEHPKSVALLLISGHFYLQHKSYNHALRLYKQAYNLQPENPTTMLCLAVILLLKSTVMFAKYRNRDVVAAFSLLYALLDMRKRHGTARPELVMESYYNLAVAFHLVGLFQYAIPYYKKILVSKTPFTRSAAHNLACIYKNAGALEAAQQVYRFANRV